MTVLVDPMSARFVKGSEIDYKEALMGGGFAISNPNAIRTCGCGSRSGLPTRKANPSSATDAILSRTRAAGAPCLFELPFLRPSRGCYDGPPPHQPRRRVFSHPRRTALWMTSGLEGPNAASSWKG